MGSSALPMWDYANILSTMINFVTTVLHTNTVLLSPHCVQVVGVAAATGWDQLMGDY